jgi:hypothetical protein
VNPALSATTRHEPLGKLNEDLVPVLHRQRVAFATRTDHAYAAASHRPERLDHKAHRDETPRSSAQAPHSRGDIDGHAIPAIVTRAVVLARRGTHGRALGSLEEGLRAFPGDPELLPPAGLATVDSSPAFAVADARRVAQLTPDNPWQLCRVAEVAYHLGGHEEAEVHVRRAAELVPPSFLTRQRFVHLYGLLTWNRHAIQRRRPEHRILEAALSAATP